MSSSVAIGLEDLLRMDVDTLQQVLEAGVERKRTLLSVNGNVPARGGEPSPTAPLLFSLQVKKTNSASPRPVAGCS